MHVSADHGRSFSAASVSVPRIGVAATPPSPIRARTHDAVVHVEREPDGDAGDVVEPALGDLVERGQPGQRQRNADRADQLVGPTHALSVSGEVVGKRDLPAHRRRRPARPLRRAPAARAANRRSASRCPRFPPSVAPLRISRDANCGNNAASTGTLPVEVTFDLSKRQRGADLDRVEPCGSARAVRAAGRWPRRSPHGAPRRLTSTPQSVQPGDRQRRPVARAAAAAPRRASAGRTNSRPAVLQPGPARARRRSAAACGQRVGRRRVPSSA